MYNVEDLEIIVKRSAELLGVTIDKNAAIEIAKRSRGTPRIVNRILKRVVDFAIVLGNGNISEDIVKIALSKLRIDDMGLNETDRRMLKIIFYDYSRGPVGAETLAASLRRRNRYNRRCY